MNEQQAAFGDCEAHGFADCQICVYDRLDTIIDKANRKEQLPEHHCDGLGSHSLDGDGHCQDCAYSSSKLIAELRAENERLRKSLADSILKLNDVGSKANIKGAKTERSRIVTWLRERNLFASDDQEGAWRYIADAIERGEHNE